MALWRCRVKMLLMSLRDQSWYFIYRYPRGAYLWNIRIGPDISGSFSGGNCHRSVSVEICSPEMPPFGTPCDTPQVCCIGWISLCEYIIFQWGNPQELFFVWNNGKEYVLGDGRGSGASTLQAFMNLGTLRLPRTNTAQCFTLLTVKPNFMCWTSTYLEQNWNYPLIAPLALSCIASI